jgi:hypothetical protein
MNTMMSACGVLCSDCAAYLAKAKGLEYQQQVAGAWRRIYGLNEAASNISCGGCVGPDEDIFHTSVRCAARRCCRGKGLNSCSECPEERCEDLEHAQSVWDGVPGIASSLSSAEFETYARPYCGHRERLAAARGTGASSGRTG